MTEHQLYQPGVLLGNLQEWVLQDAHLGVHLGSFSGVRHLHPSFTHPHHAYPAAAQAHVRDVPFNTSCMSRPSIDEQAHTTASMLSASSYKSTVLLLGYGPACPHAGLDIVVWSGGTCRVSASLHCSA